MKNIIGREKEIQILGRILSSKTPEFLAVYGRRRVGKTFLIRQFFQDKKAIFLNVSGSKDGLLSEQTNRFVKEIGRVFYGGAALKTPNSWDEAFSMLTDAFKLVPANKPIVLFFDEFPWMATRNSRLLQNLDYYWNQYWSQDKRIKLIICGSSASWIIEKIVNNKGGLHNRLTQSILLEPFDLADTKKFLNHMGVKLTHDQILTLYMAVGGVPYYLTQIEKGQSAAQNIDRLAFQNQSFLLKEFDNLFAALYDNHERYVEMIRLISRHRYGIGQEELLKQMGVSVQGKTGLKMLKDLQDANFIIGLKSHFNKKRGIYYRTIDEYVCFYLDWIEPIKGTLLTKRSLSGYWEQQQKSPSWNSWAGYAFEAICYKHIAQIAQVLGVGVTAVPDTWRYVPRKKEEGQGAQIDLLFDRDDDSMTICELKYTNEAYIIDKNEYEQLNKKIDVFKAKTGTKKQLFLAIVSAHGLKKTLYAEENVSGVVTLDDLFLRIKF